MNAKKISIKYCEDVLNGKVIAGNAIKMACQRFLNDLKRDDLDFRDEKVDTLIKLGKCLHHYKGSSANKPFTLEPWQVFIAANIFGWYWKKSNKRRFIQSYTQIARKNGKTALNSLFALFALFADGEPAAEVISASAQSRDQAAISFEMIKTFSKQLDPSGKTLRPYRNEVKIPKTNSQLKVISSDSNSQDGKNISFAILDEVGDAKDNSMHDVIISSMGQRTSPHLAMITTAYFDKEAPAYQFRLYCLDILNGVKEDDTVFAAIYELDEGDDWTDEKVWVKANPNLGITVQLDYLRSQVKTALNNPTDQTGVLTKNLNMWVESECVWIPNYKVREQMKHIELEDFNPDEWLCFCGVDLGSVSDLTALSFLLTNGDEYYVKNFYFVPQTALKDKFMSQQYREWSRNGYLFVTEGNTTDYSFITDILVKWHNELNIRGIAYDRWNAAFWAIDCTEKGLPLEEYPQSIGYFNAPTREVERLMLNGKMFIDDNPINLHCFENVILKCDYVGNVKPKKDMSLGHKVDGVISLIEAVGLYIREPHYSNEVYTF